MAFNITEFRNHFHSFSQPNHFDLYFRGGFTNNGFPNGMKHSEYDKYFMANGMKHRAFSTQLPGRTLDVVERKYSGPTRLVPTGYVYQALPISIYETREHNVKPFFDKWMETVAQHDYWFTKYYDDIIMPNLVLDLYPKNPKISSAKQATPIATYILSEVYPISMNAVQLDWNTTNALTIINIEIQYHRWVAVDYTPKTDLHYDGGVNKLPSQTEQQRQNSFVT